LERAATPESENQLSKHLQTVLASEDASFS
jgi:hypothetical protein